MLIIQPQPWDINCGISIGYMVNMVYNYGGISIVCMVNMVYNQLMKPVDLDFKLSQNKVV